MVENIYKKRTFGLDGLNRKNSKEIDEKISWLARKISEDFGPESVLVCGDYSENLVLQLKNIGVKAYGVRPLLCKKEGTKDEFFCEVFFDGGNWLPENFPKAYDLVVCGEISINFGFKDQFALFNKFCELSNFLFFVKRSEGCLKNSVEDGFSNYFSFSALVGENGMFRNLDLSFSFKNLEVAVFQRSNISNAISGYEQKISFFEKELKALEDKLLKYSQVLVVWRKYGAESIRIDNKIKDLELQIYALRMVERQYNEILRSTFWRLTAPFRFMVDVFKKIFRLFLRCGVLFCKGIISLFTRGPAATFRKVIGRSRPYDGFNVYALFKKYFKRITPTDVELKFQKNRKFRKNVKFSVVVPLYNTPIDFLKEMIDSVVNQTYSNWQLCLADGSDGEFSSEIEEYCLNCAKEDSRIVYKKLTENGGISENTNEALKLANGDYVAMLDHDDLLSPTALFENACVIEKEGADFLYSDEITFEKDLTNIRFMNFKPDFSPDFLLTNNYICHLSVFSVELLKKVGLYCKEFDGSQDYDMILRLSEKAKKIVHIPKVLYYWRATSNSVAKGIEAKFYCIEAAKKAISNHLERVGLKATVEETDFNSVYRVKYEIIGCPKISILIANKDGLVFLSDCINSILTKSTYKNFEIIIIENNSCSETLDYYKVLEKKDPRIKVVYYYGDFNYSAINNFGVKYAKGEYFLFLNNDTKIITPNWLEEMLMFAQRKDIGIVGAKLYYDDDTIQHAGVIIGLGGVAGHAHKALAKNDPGYVFRAKTVQNLSAVTAACLMARRDVWNVANGFDEEIKVAFNDVDFCLRVRRLGFLVVFTPHAELYHFESKSRGQDDTFEKKARFMYEIKFMKDRWGKALEKDPYYNPNLSLKTENFLPDII